MVCSTAWCLLAWVCTAVAYSEGAASATSSSFHGSTDGSSFSPPPGQRVWCAEPANAEPASIAPPSVLAALLQGPHLLWSDALFQVPKELVFPKEQGHGSQEVLTLDPYGLAHLLCALELPYVAPLDYLGLCGRRTWEAEPRFAACESDGICVLRAPVYRQPCVNLTSLTNAHATEQWSRDIQFLGVDPWVRFGQIRKMPIGESDMTRPWERFFVWTSTRGDYGGGVHEVGGGGGGYHHEPPQAPIQSLPRYPTYLLLGILMLAAAEPLSENRAFHMVVSATMGMAVSSVLALIVLLWLMNNFRAVLRQNPLGVWMENIAWIAPRVALPFVLKLGPIVGVFYDRLLDFWNRGLEPYLGFAPWAGKAYFGIGALVGFVVERSRGWFRYTRDEVLDDGKELSSCGQVYLYQGIRWTAVVCFMHSTANLEASVLITLVAYRWDVIQYWLFRIHMYENRSPYYAKREMTRAEYQDEARDYTAQELRKLREHLNQNSGDMWRLNHGRNQTEGFMRGNDHVVRTFPDAAPSRLAGLGALMMQALLTTAVLAVSAMVVLDYNPLRDLASIQE